MMHPLLEQLQREISTSLGGLDAAQTQLRPTGDPTQWSIQQVTEHLLLTYHLTSNQFESRLAKGKPTRRRPTLVQRISQEAVCRFGYFPHGRQSPAAVMPSDSGTASSGETLAAQTHDALARLDALAAAAERLFGDKRSAVHHVLGPLNSQQWMRFHLVHGQHHVRKVRAIRAAHAI